YVQGTRDLRRRRRVAEPPGQGCDGAVVASGNMRSDDPRRRPIEIDERRQARLKIARQALPGKPTGRRTVPAGQADGLRFSRPYRDFVLLESLPGSSCRATLKRPCRGWFHEFFGGHGFQAAL